MTIRVRSGGGTGRIATTAIYHAWALEHRLCYARMGTGEQPRRHVVRQSGRAVRRRQGSPLTAHQSFYQRRPLSWGAAVLRDYLILRVSPNANLRPRGNRERFTEYSDSEGKVWTGAVDEERVHYERREDVPAVIELGLFRVSDAGNTRHPRSAPTLPCNAQLSQN